MTAPLIPKKKPAKYQDWSALRDEWVEGQLLGGSRALTLRQFAEKHGLGYQTLLNRSAAGKWSHVLSDRRKANDELLAKQLKERSEKAIAVVNEEFVNREADIRSRHAKMARGLQAKAFQKLGTVQAESLTVREALAMLELGLNEERFAMGLDHLYKAPPEAAAQHPEYKSLAQQWEGHRKVQDVAVLLLRKLKESGLDPTSAVSDATIVKEVGLAPKS